MPKLYHRKKLTKADQVLKALNQFHQSRAPKKASFVPGFPTHYRESLRRLCDALRELTEAENSSGYSALLQVWLSAYGLGWPRNVFVTDLAISGSGRLPKTNLAFNAWILRRQEPKLGWRKIAKKLLRTEWENDPVRAANKVRQAVEGYRDIETPLDTVTPLCRQILGIKSEDMDE